MNHIYQSVGRKIKALRKSAGMTQQQLSEIMGYSRTSITNIEAGRQHIDLETLLELCSILAVEPAELLPMYDKNMTYDERIAERINRLDYLDKHQKQWCNQVLSKALKGVEQ